MRMKLYITPEGSANVIMDCPEEPKYTDYVQHTKYYWQVNKFERAKRDYEQALAEAKKNSIPFESQKEVTNKLFPNSAPFTDSIHPFPSDQYKVEIKEELDFQKDCDTDTFFNKRQVAVLSPVKRHKDESKCTKPNCDCIEQAEKKAGGPVKSYPCLAGGFERADYKQSFKDSKLFQKPQEDKLISEEPAWDELRHALQLIQNNIEELDARSGMTSGLKEAWNLISDFITKNEDR